jgi:uncharacterized protein YjiS (DUF1127 family)
MPPQALTEALDRWLRLWLNRRNFLQLLDLDDGSLEVLGVRREENARVCQQRFRCKVAERTALD